MDKDKRNVPEIESPSPTYYGVEHIPMTAESLQAQSGEKPLTPDMTSSLTGCKHRVLELSPPHSLKCHEALALIEKSGYRNVMDGTDVELLPGVIMRIPKWTTKVPVTEENKPDTIMDITKKMFN